MGAGDAGNGRYAADQPTSQAAHGGKLAGAFAKAASGGTFSTGRRGAGGALFDGGAAVAAAVVEQQRDEANAGGDERLVSAACPAGGCVAVAQQPALTG